MSSHSSAGNLSWLIVVLSLLVAVKLMWVSVAYLFLPERGIEPERGSAKSSLYYRYRLISETALAQPKKSNPKMTKQATSMRGYHLTGIYSAKQNSIVALLKGKKNYVVGSGEAVDGFVLKRTTAQEAYFEKNDKHYTLKLQTKGGKGNVASITPTKKKIKNDNYESEKRKEASGITTKGGRTVVPRKLLMEYTNDRDKIWKDIGLGVVKRGGAIRGFKVRFVRRDSTFQDLGLKRGDVIKAVNGEPLVDMTAPMEILKRADSIDALMLTIERGNEEKDLEYEIN